MARPWMNGAWAHAPCSSTPGPRILDWRLVDRGLEAPGLEARGAWAHVPRCGPKFRSHAVDRNFVGWDRNVDRNRGPKCFLVVGIDAEVDKLVGQIVAPMLQTYCKNTINKIVPHFGPHFGPTPRNFGPTFRSPFRSPFRSHPEEFRSHPQGQARPKG